MSASVRIIPSDDGSCVLIVDSHIEQMYVTVGLTREEVLQLGAELHRCLMPLLTVVGKDSP